jgi:phosphoribosylaminoimidazolecarboxamide formyltransferase/IMP cyclohydrolase
MPDLVPVRRVLVSVSDKTDLVPFVRGLLDVGVETIVSTGGTAATLEKAGIPVTSVETLTGFPEMMDGRVKTLHPAVHGALLARRDDAGHVASMDQHGITPIDMVVVNLYPFEQTIARGDVSPAEAIEQIDIGGPAVIRSSAKNHDSVAVVTDIQQYDSIVEELRTNEGALTLGTRRTLAAAAFMRTAAYDTAISAWMGVGSSGGDVFPSLLQLSVSHHRSLRYGENPHQSAAVYANPATAGPNLVTAEVLGGKALSYNNVGDASAAVRAVRDLAMAVPDRAAVVVVKHTNPCGGAVRPDAAEAFRAAHAGDPQAAYGGILATSTTIDADVAAAIASEGSFFEVIVAPDITDEAHQALQARWANVRLLRLPGLTQDAGRVLEMRSVLGGLLVQERDDKLPNPAEWNHVAGPKPDPAMIEEAVVAWTMVKHATSNGIAITRGGALVGIGTGQVDRVSACRLAVGKAADRLAAGDGISVAASDAFFPFPDGPEVLIDAGVRCLIHPGGSKRDNETNELCEARGVTCIHTGVRHFRH